MSYDKKHRWSGGYYWGYWRRKDEEKESSSPSETKGTSYYDYPGDDDYYYDGDEVDYESLYKKKYKSSLGYSGIGGGSLWGGSSSYRYGSTFSFSGLASGLRADEFDEFKEVSTVIQKAVKESRDLVVILDFPFSVKISFSNSEVSQYKDDRKIFVPTNYLDDKSKTGEEKIKLFCSLAVHEATHLKYSELKVHDKFFANLEADAGTDEKRKRLIRLLVNLIEDERIEDRLLKERPGYLEFVETEKQYQYETFISIMTSKEARGSMSFLINLFRLIRFPKNIDEDIIKKYNDIYEKVGSIVCPLPESTKESCLAAKKVYDVVAEAVKDFPEIEKELNRLPAFDTTSDILWSLNHGTDQSNLMCPNRGSISSVLKDRMAGEYMESICDGSMEFGVEKNVYFNTAEQCEWRYKKRLAEVSKYIPGVRKLIQGYDKNFTFNIPGCRSGMLDTTKLAEAYQGVPQVYIRQGKAITNKLAVCILIDESGSMCGSKEERAAEGAILLYEALKNEPGVELFVYGHTGDQMYSGSTEITVYAEHGKKLSRYGLGSSRAKYENRDGLAILEVAKRVRKQTDLHMLMFVLSDGQPSAHNYRGYGAVLDTKEKVAKAEKLDIDIIQISIDYVPAAKEMFKNYIDISGDCCNLAKKLSCIIKKLIVKNKSTVITTQ